MTSESEQVRLVLTEWSDTERNFGPGIRADHDLLARLAVDVCNRDRPPVGR